MDKREGEVSRFASNIVCLTVPKNAVGQPFSHSLISGIEKVWIRGGREMTGVSHFSVENFLFHNAENFCGGTLLCCVSENFWQRKSSWIRGSWK